MEIHNKCFEESVPINRFEWNSQFQQFIFQKICTIALLAEMVNHPN